MNIKAMIFFFITFGCGCLCGYKLHNKRINDKLEYMYVLYESIKKRNNDFLTNFMTLYSKQSGSEGKYTDMDEYIQSMWMD